MEWLRIIVDTHYLYFEIVGPIVITNGIGIELWTPMNRKP
jgi:hypothetical protein